MNAALTLALLICTADAYAANLLERGKAVYKANCVACHGDKGDGNGPAAAAINGQKPRDFVAGKFLYGSDSKSVLKTVTDGVPGAAMPSWRHLSLEDREAVVEYVRSLKK